MSVTAITNESFENIVQDHDIVIIDFWATWCGPCRAFAPVYEKASANHDDVFFAKVDTQAQRELAAAFEIRSIPTLMVFREQELVFRRAGALPAPALEELLDKVKNLDMDEVRRQNQQHANAEPTPEAQ